MSTVRPTAPEVDRARRRELSAAAAEAASAPEPSWKGDSDGVVVYGGGVYTASAYVCIRAIRAQGCSLPIQLWHLGRAEVPEPARQPLASLGIELVDARELGFPAALGGWELKSFSMLRTGLRRVIALDADCYPVAGDVSGCLSWPELDRCGAVLWPDDEPHDVMPRVWRRLGVSETPSWSVESGVMLVDTVRCHRELRLCWHVNERSAHYYCHFHGDKETYPLAWRRMGTQYAMPPYRWRRAPGALLQHDFSGRVTFVHRCGDKWRLAPTQFRDTVQARPGMRFCRELPMERECFSFLRDWALLVKGEEDATAEAAAVGKYVMSPAPRPCPASARLSLTGDSMTAGCQCRLERHWSVVRGRLVLRAGDGRPLAVLSPQGAGWLGARVGSGEPMALERAAR
jgi:hypothetical protein